MALAAAYTTRYNRLRVAAGATVARMWDRFAGLDDAAALDFADHAARVVHAAQVQASALVDGYLAAMTTVVADATIRPEPVDLSNLRDGVAPIEVYARGIVTARAAIAAGSSYLDAMTAGRRRSTSTAETDVALAQRAAMDAAVDGERIIGYRRVLTGSSCALCATASTQRYHRAELMPIHSHCDCGVAPIIGDHDPGHVINRKLLAELKLAGRAGGEPAYWESRHFTVDPDGAIRMPDVAVHDHGELGPVLTVADHDFTGPAAVAI